MTYFTKLKDITNIKTIRTSQLEKQNQTDSELNIIKNKCPNLVVQYLLEQRRLSRIQQEEMINSSVLDIFNVIYKHFKENDKIYENFNQITKSTDITNKCKLLEELLM